MNDITALMALKGQAVKAPYYLAECMNCGEVMPSNKLVVSRNYPDGDADCYCPHCNVDDCEIADLGTGEEPASWAWNFQQKRIDALVEALEHYKSREERVTKLVLDNSVSWEKLFKQLEEAKQRNAELVEALEKAQQAANINNQWKPDVCPITGRRFFMWIEHPEQGCVPTYGGPLDSYTIPTRDSDGEFSCERFDHDVGDWVDGECVGAYLIDDDEQCRVYELEQNVSELREQLRTVELSNSVLESRTVTVKLPAACADDEYFNDGVFQPMRYERDVERALRAAGIQVIEGDA